MSKKVTKKIHIITDGKQDNNHKGSRIIATGTIEQLESFKQQLVEHGYNDIFTIEERETSGRNTSVRLQGFELAEHRGMLYPKRNIDLAYRAAVKQTQSLTNTLSCLNELKTTASETEALTINNTMIIVNNKIEDIKNRNFDVQMI